MYIYKLRTRLPEATPDSGKGNSNGNGNGNSNNKDDYIKPIFVASLRKAIPRLFKTLERITSLRPILVYAVVVVILDRIVQSNRLLIGNELIV